jgi:hypothetical protein
MIGVTKGMRILLGHNCMHVLWTRFGLDRPLINTIIRFLDLPVRVFRQLELNPRYAPNRPGGLTNQINDLSLENPYTTEKDGKL